MWEGGGGTFVHIGTTLERMGFLVRKDDKRKKGVIGEDDQDVGSRAHRYLTVNLGLNLRVFTFLLHVRCHPRSAILNLIVISNTITITSDDTADNEYNEYNFNEVEEEKGGGFSSGG